MKAINWLRWLLVACVCAALLPSCSARYKYRHQQPQMYKKSWPVGPRISNMGNHVHINVGPSGYKHHRHAHKPSNNNYNRYSAPNPVRRPMNQVFAVLPAWKTQAILGQLANQGTLPQRGPVKEFHSMNKVAEYSPEYRPEAAMPPSPSHGHMDDDKGPIHTIPAPNLSPADKPYNMPSHNYPPSDSDYTQSIPGPPLQSTISNYNIFGTQGTSLPPQRTTTGPTSPAPTLHRYEVTETNEIGPQDYRTVQPSYFTPEFDVTRLSDFASTGSHTSEVYASRPGSSSNTGLIGTGLQFGQQNGPMQTNLHSSLYVGFPGSALQSQPPSESLDEQESPELHVGHPAPAGPPLSANQLYDLLNSFPQQFNTEQQSPGQQQQQQQQQYAVQQQLDQLFQPESSSSTQFSPPQMHSFNYDEQSNKRQRQRQQQQQQQQHLFAGQDYASGRVTADYSLEPDNRDIVRSTSVSSYPGDTVDSENHIEYEEKRDGQTIYLSQLTGDGSLSSQFYTTLPSRDAAEKLAALAAAGNVNSHLIGQLKKQHQSSRKGEVNPYPPNHRDADDDDETRFQQPPRFVHRIKQQREREQEKNVEEEQHYQQQKEEKRPLRIMVPDLEEYGEDIEQRAGARIDGDSTRGSREDYEYEEPDELPRGPEAPEEAPGKQGSQGSETQSVYRGPFSSEFGSRLGPITE